MGNKTSVFKIGRKAVEGEPSESIAVNNSHVTAGVQAILGGDNNKIVVENISVGVPHTEIITEGIELQITEPVSSFHGRSKELNKLEQAFNKKQSNRKYKLVVICGIGGAGKTECARAYIRRHRLSFTNLIWLHCETLSDINKSFEKLFTKMNLPNNSDVQDIYDYLNSPKTLFIFDNSEDLRSIQRFLPEKNNQSLFLVTSQVKTWSPFESIELGELSELDAVEVLISALQVHDIQVDNRVLEGLLNNIGRLPLILHISAGYISQQVLDFRSIDANYDIEEVIKKLEIGEVIVAESFPPFYLNPYSKSLYAAVSRTLQRIWNNTDPVALIAADMLGLAAYLHPEEINSSIFNVILKVEDGMLLGKACALLVNYSLFQKESITEFHMHRNVQECLRYHFAKNKTNKYFSFALRLLLFNNLNWHFGTVIDHAEKNLEALYMFYVENNSRQLHETLAEYSSCNLITKFLILSSNLKQSPEFLWALAKYKRKDLIQVLLLNKADINVKDENGFTALHHACLEPNGWKFLQIIKFLTNLGALVNHQTNFGNTLLHTVSQARTDKEEDIFWGSTILLLHGVDPQIKNIENKTAADEASHNGLTLVAKLLTSAEPRGQNIPQMVIKCRQFQCLQDLLYNDLINVNSQDESGCTVLHALCSLRTEEDEIFDVMTELLWLYCADVRIINNKGHTAADLAQILGHNVLADLLQPTKTNSRALLVAAKHGKLHLLTMWKYMSYQDESGCTPLHELCDMDKCEASDAELISIIKETGMHRLRYKGNRAGCCPAQVARRRGRHKLAMWLESEHYRNPARRARRRGRRRMRRKRTRRRKHD